MKFHTIDGNRIMSIIDCDTSKANLLCSKRIEMNWRKMLIQIENSSEKAIGIKCLSIIVIRVRNNETRHEIPKRKITQEFLLFPSSSFHSTSTHYLRQKKYKQFHQKHMQNSLLFAIIFLNFSFLLFSHLHLPQ